MNLPAHVSYAVGYGLVGKAVLWRQRLKEERGIRARMQRDPAPAVAPPLVASARMKELMSRHYLEARYATGVRKVAWVTSGAPVEILQALGFLLIYPENHAALCGARRKAVDMCVEAEHAGYSRDLCSYARTDIGTAISGKAPITRLPKPDLLLCCTNICQTVLYWYRVLAHHFRVPLFVIDTPFLYEGAQPHQVDYVKQQLEEAIPVAEQVAGRSLSFAKLKAIVGASKQASELWLEILNRAQHRPSPISAFDGFINMGPIVDLRGEPETIRFYETLLAEVDRRIAAGIGAVREERLRVLWDNLPIWYRMGWLSGLLAPRGVSIVASDYTYAWGELAPMMDTERPLESAARVYLHPILNRSTGDKLRSMRRMVGDFHCDGVILHSDRSCKPYSLGQIAQRDRLANEIGVPAFLLEADHSDSRAFSEEQATNRLEAFIELMEARA
jgi:benzoyl-CoA reductase/2-hydroxyglutaryl-CoA dehydratase subunit BcrC/BadD/HgdB